MDIGSFKKSLYATVVSAAVGYVYYEVSPIGSVWHNALKTHNLDDGRDPMKAWVATIGLMFFMASILEYLIRIDHINKWALSSPKVVMAVGGRVFALLTFFDLPHAFIGGQCLKIFFINRVFDFLIICTQTAVLGKLLRFCHNRRENKKAETKEHD